MSAPLSLPPSLWAATAGPAASPQPLHGVTRTDVAIVGGGYTGLSAALHLAEAGMKVRLLEAGEIGWGASGRNGGQVNPGLTLDPPLLHRHLGHEQADAAIDFAGHAPDLVFDLIRRHGLQCDAVRPGWLQPAHRTAALGALEARCRAWQAHGVSMLMLDREQTRQAIGTDRYAGALLDPRGGSVHPLRYARELARAARNAGASIHEHSPVHALEREGRHWKLEGPQGTVIASHVLVATNGYTDGLVPKLRQSVVAANSYQIATQPLPPELASRILPQRHAASDTRRLVLYFRKDAENRLIIGGRGRFADPRGAHDFSHLEKALGTLFPEATDIPIAYRWAGRVAMTVNRLPHVHEPEPGVLVALGYNGRGVAMATAMGWLIARRLSGDQARWPLPVSPIHPIPFHGLRRAYVGAATAWYMLRDEI